MRWIAKTSILSIRPYQTTDRQALMKIASDTAFFGKPIEIYLMTEHFLGSFFAYYTDFELQNAWIATADDIVVGFLTGCLNTREQIRITKEVLYPKVILKLLGEKYKVGKKWLITRS